MFFSYNPPASYYEPVDAPDTDCRVADGEFYLEVVYDDGSTDLDVVSDWEIEEYYNHIKADAEEMSEFVEVNVYEVYEYYYVDKYGDEEVEYTEVGEKIYSEKL